MAEQSYPFDANGAAGTGGQANVLESEWQRIGRSLLSTGVVEGHADSGGLLAVTANGAAMQVTLATGLAWVEGFVYRNDAALALPIGAADATNPRIDTVVVRLDRANNNTRAFVKQGAAAASPAAPALTQTDLLWELPLADVRVDAAVGVIAAGKVTSRRVLTGPGYRRAEADSKFLDAGGDLLTGPLGLGVGGALAPDLGARPAADLPGTYPEGLSIAVAADTGGWPGGAVFGSVLTVKRGTDAVQTLTVLTGAEARQTWRRTASSAGNFWTAWRIVTDETVPGTGQAATAGRGTALSLPNGVDTYVPWTSGDTHGDADAFFDPANPTRMNMRRAGLYVVSSYIVVGSPSTVTGAVTVQINRAGFLGAARFSGTLGAGTNVIGVHGVERFGAGAFVESMVRLDGATGSVEGGFYVQNYLRAARIGH